MTLDELDKLAAEKVMGWEWNSVFIEAQRIAKMFDDKSGWQPTRNIAQAWECLEKFAEEGWPQVSIAEHASGDAHWFARMIDDRDSAYALTAPEAIVRACLKAKGVEV